LRSERRNEKKRRREEEKKRREGALKGGTCEAPHRNDGASKVSE
jgi:hypothetical protein